jgi:hypothetical protein
VASRGASCGGRTTGAGRRYLCHVPGQVLVKCPVIELRADHGEVKIVAFPEGTRG